MKLAGMQNLSLVDFPGHLAAAIFVQGCNFRCGYCQNPELVTLKTEFEFSAEKALEGLARRKDKLEGVVISGGEPTQYDDLPDLAGRLKDMGFKVKVDTNGARPEVIETLLRSRLVDYLAIDIKTSFRKYGMVTELPEIDKAVSCSIGLAILSTVPYEFRTTCVPGLVDGEDLKMIAEEVKGAKKFCLQQFRPQITFDKKYQEVEPYTKADIEGFKQILSEYVEEVEIRGI